MRARWGVLCLVVTACGGSTPPPNAGGPAAGEPVPPRARAHWVHQATFTGGFGTAAGSWMAIDVAPDQNGDGAGDLIVGQPYWTERDLPGIQGRVLVVDGRTLEILRTFVSTDDGMFGSSVAALGDVDGDGQLDLAAGVPGKGIGDAKVDFTGELRLFLTAGLPPRHPAGRARRRTPRPGWRSVPGTTAEGYFGYSLAFVGGERAILVVSRPSFLGGKAVGLDARTGAVLYTTGGSPLDNDQISERRGYGIAPISDLDGDGVADFVMRAPGQAAGGDTRSTYGGRIYFHSGADGAVLAAIEGAPSDMIGIDAFAEIGDVDGDGAADYLVGAAYRAAAGHAMAGAAFVVSGKPVRDAAASPRVLSLATEPDLVIREHAGAGAIELTGFAAARLFDVDGDGVTDYAIGSPGHSPSPEVRNAGRVHVYSGRSGKLLSELAGSGAGFWFGELIACDPASRTLHVGAKDFGSGAGRIDTYRWQ